MVIGVGIDVMLFRRIHFGSRMKICSKVGSLSFMLCDGNGFDFFMEE